MASTNEAARFLDYYLDASVESEYGPMGTSNSNTSIHQHLLTWLIRRKGS